MHERTEISSNAPENTGAIPEWRITRPIATVESQCPRAAETAGDVAITRTRSDHMADPTAKRGSIYGRALDRGDQAPKPYYDIDESTGCWNWNRSRSAAGYGNTRYNGQYTGAHRAYHAHYNGPVPAGMVVMHKCDNPSCVNPEHLRVGSQGENTRDRDRKGRNRNMPGASNGAAVLTPKGVEAIFELRERGWLHREIAEAMGVTGANVSQILNGKRRASDRAA